MKYQVYLVRQFPILGILQSQTGLREVSRYRDDSGFPQTDQPDHRTSGSPTPGCRACLGLKCGRERDSKTGCPVR